MLPIKTILHPTDFSRQAESGFHLACALARDYKARLILIHVEPPPETVVGEFGAVPPPAEDDESREALKNQLFEMKPTDSEINVEYFFVEGDPVREIVAMAKDHGADLIVMGTHGRTGLSRLLMGSVAEQVMRESPCPVLTLKTPFHEA